MPTYQKSTWNHNQSSWESVSEYDCSYSHQNCISWTKHCAADYRYNWYSSRFRLHYLYLWKVLRALKSKMFHDALRPNMQLHLWILANPYYHYRTCLPRRVANQVSSWILCCCKCNLNPKYSFHLVSSLHPSNKGLALQWNYIWQMELIREFL